MAALGVGTPRAFQRRIVLPCGEAKWVQTMACPVMDADGSVTKINGRHS